MNQYVPVYQAEKYPEINRKLTKEEFQKVFDYYLHLGFHQGWVQEGGDDSLLPDFRKKKPFGVFSDY